jgi:CRISPR-associated exonuclease Cas4
MNQGEPRGAEDAVDQADDTGAGTLVPVSAVEHYSYCPRQCALIHVEQTFDDNLYTIRGRLLHEVVDEGSAETADGVRILRGLPIWSERHGLIGKADVVELRPGGPYPIEYKSGPARGIHADLQLCAQALCLEEMFGEAVPRGAIYHYRQRRRREAELGEALRQRTISVIDQTRAMLVQEAVPPPTSDRRRCKRCSLADACLPEVTGDRRHVGGLAGSLYRPMEDVDDA